MPRKRGNPSWGTSYFTSKGAAVRYYKDYEGDLESAKHAVEIKLREGSIHIGKPPLKAGQRLSTTDGGKRYMIVEDNTRRNPLSLFKKYYVTCDGKKFGPYHTMAKAKKVAETVARVLDKPAKILGAATTRTNPSIRKTKKRMKRLAGFQKADLTLNLLRRGRGGVKPKRKFKASTKRKTNLKRKANPKRKYTVTASLRSTGRPKFKTITATSLEDAKRKARKWMDSTFKKSSGPVDFSITY